MKEQILWLVRDSNNIYSLFKGSNKIIDFHAMTWKFLCSNIELEPGEQCKVKLTQTKKGIRLERI